MQTENAVELADRILVVAPTADDAPLIVRVLEEHDFSVEAVDGLAALARELRRGAGAILISSEAFEDAEGVETLREALQMQESWSEMPVLFLGGNAEDAARPLAEILGASAQIVLLERPLGIATFVTATAAALRSRRRQYEVKRLLDELASSALQITRAHEDATRAKDEFLATLGHELRSPMTAIRGWIQMLKSGDLTHDETQTALDMMESSTKVQSRIVEDLMDVSRIMAGKVMIEPSAIDLAPIVRGVVATFTPSALEQGIELSVSVPDDAVLVWADATRVQQIGWNLISNAIKFTPRGGSVRVGLTHMSEVAVIRVRDDGEGIAAELLPHVFERYRQADRGSKKQQGGLGLGLAIVRHLVESHGGTIEAISEGAGKGAEFVVTLPVHDAHAAHA